MVWLLAAIIQGIRVSPETELNGPIALQARGRWFDPSCAHEEVPGQSTCRSSSRSAQNPWREPPVQNASLEGTEPGRDAAQRLLRSRKCRDAVNACPAQVITGEPVLRHLR